MIRLVDAEHKGKGPISPQEIVNGYDPDHKGKINFEEFQNLCRNYPMVFYSGLCYHIITIFVFYFYFYITSLNIISLPCTDYSFILLYVSVHFMYTPYLTISRNVLPSTSTPCSMQPSTCKKISSTSLWAKPFHRYTSDMSSPLHIYSPLLRPMLIYSPHVLCSPAPARRSPVSHVGEDFFCQSHGEETSSDGVTHVSTGTQGEWLVDCLIH